MLPAATARVWTEIATGKRPIRSDNLAINLLAKRNQTSFDKDRSPANQQRLAEETYRFFARFEKLYASLIAKLLA